MPLFGRIDDLLDAERLDRLEQLGGARVHGLPAVDDRVAAELAEELLVAGAGHDGDDHGAALADLRRRGRQPLVALARLRVHVVDLDVPDGAVLERFAEHGAGVVDVHVHLDGALVAHHERAVAERQEERLERLAVDALAADEEARAVAELGELARLLDGDGVRPPGPDRSDERIAGRPRRDARAGDHLAAAHEVLDARRQAAEEHEQAVAAGVDDAGLLQGRQLRGRVLDRDPAGLFHGGEQVLEPEAVGDRLRRRGHLADDGEHGALDRRLDGPVGGVLTLDDGALEHGGVERVGLAPHLADAAHDLGEDDAGVAARAHQRALGHRRGDRGDVPDVALLELLDDRAHRERHVGARVAVRHRVHVEVVDELALSLDGRERGLDDADGGGADDQSWRSSTRTLISPTGTPPTCSTW